MFDLEKYIQESYGTKEKFKKLEKFLMTRMYDEYSLIHPGIFLRCSNLLNFEGSYVFYLKQDISHKARQKVLIYPEI